MGRVVDFGGFQYKKDKPSCKQRWRLKQLGKRDEEIDKMTKKQAYDYIAENRSRWVEYL